MQSMPCSAHMYGMSIENVKKEHGNTNMEHGNRLMVAFALLPLSLTKRRLLD